MMFGRKLRRREGSRGLDGCFGGYLAGIHRFGKKIGCWRIPHFFEKIKIFRYPIFLSSLQIPTKQPSNASSRHLITSRFFRLPPNIIDSQTQA
jgi:hypothetical protein